MNEPSAKASRDGVIFEVHVTPSAREDSVSWVDGVLKVRTVEPADKDKANRAVLKLLKPLLGPCRMVSGMRSKRKKICAENIGLDRFNAVLAGLSDG